MRTNEIKKGTRVRLRNGWEAEIADNAMGNTRVAKVFGFVTEMGSVYSHDICHVNVNGVWYPVEHTPAQLKLRARVASL